MSYDVSAGKKIFSKNCSACHRVNNTGNEIGPELTAIGKKFDREGLLDAVINPSGGIVFGYESWIINTKKGESFFGFLVADGTKTIVLKDLAGNKQIIPKAEIISREKQKKSLMPEPSALNLTKQDLSDIAGYLATLKDEGRP
jgi:putative heme-binding domain-containing protein